MVSVCTLVAAVGCLVSGGESPFLSARPCWSEGRETESNVFLNVRAEVRGEGAAILRLTGQSAYKAKVNGRFVGWGPARAARGWFKVDEYPIALTGGVNAVEIEVAGYRSWSLQYLNQDSFVQAEVVQGGKVLAATPQDFSAVVVPRKRTGPLFTRQRGFPIEVRKVGAFGEAQKLAAQPAKRYLRRDVPSVDFSVVELPRAGADGLVRLPHIDSGFPIVRVRTTGPAKVELTWDEVLKDGRLEPMRLGAPKDTWHGWENRAIWEIPAAGAWELETFEPYSLMFARVRALEGEATVEGMALRHVRHRPLVRKKPRFADKELEKIYDAGCESYLQNSIDVYMDCPSRERTGWLSDTWFTAEAGAWLTGDASLERSLLETFAMTDEYPGVPEGAMYAGYPTESNVPTYTMWYALQCEQCARRLPRAESEKFVKLVVPRLLKNVAYFDTFVGRDGFLEDLSGWVFIEWSHANDLTKGVNFPANMMWAACLEATGHLAKRDDLVARANAIRSKIRETAFRDGYFRDQALRNAAGKLEFVKDTTEVAQYFAFFTGVATKESHPALWRKMIDGFGPGKTSDGLFPANILPGFMLRMELLARDGQTERLASEIKSYLLPMANLTGTIWEFAEGIDSHCHAFGSYACVYILRDILGEKPLELENY